MSDGRLDHILDAAYVCFTRHGVRRTTMDDIAREADMSRGAVYQYVRNKEDVFRRLAQRLVDGALALAARTDPGDDLADRLTRILSARLDLVLRLHRDSPHAAELLGGGSRISADLEARCDAAIGDLLTGAIADACPDADAAETAGLLMALTRGLEADLSDPDVPQRRLRHGIALLVAGLTHRHKEGT